MRQYILIAIIALIPVLIVIIIRRQMTLRDVYLTLTSCIMVLIVLVLTGCATELPDICRGAPECYVPKWKVTIINPRLADNRAVQLHAYCHETGMEHTPWVPDAFGEGQAVVTHESSDVERCQSKFPLGARILGEWV